MRRLALILLGLGLVGCIDTTIEATTVSLSVAGTDARAPFEGQAGATITLTRADVAFGPLYLCSGSTAGELCDEALAQWTDAVVVDAIRPEVVEVGSMEAITGTARSYMYDLGVVSVLTMPEPIITDAAQQLGPASVVVEGDAEVGGQTLPFRAALRIEQSGDVEQGVPVVRSAPPAIDGAILPDGRSRLVVTFDPRPWLATADFVSLVEDAPCEAGRALVCAGSVEQTCDAGGGVASARDCAASGEVCLRELGCVERLEVLAASQIGRALRNGVEAGERPTFTFREER